MVTKREQSIQDSKDYAIRETEKIKSVLVGKTIADVEVKLKRPDCDDVNILELTFTDGTKETIVGDYGGYTGCSEDEYITFIGLKED